MSDLKRGDIGPDGKIFWEYRRNRNNKESWITKQQYLSRTTVSVEKRMRRRLAEVKHRSIKANIPFDLDLEYLMSIYVENCPVFGMPLSWDTKNLKILKSSPSLDRIDCKQGYIKGNVRWLSNFANTLKNNATPEELKTFANWILYDITN